MSNEKMADMYADKIVALEKENASLRAEVERLRGELHRQYWCGADDEIKHQVAKRKQLEGVLEWVIKEELRRDNYGAVEFITELRRKAGE